MVWKKIVNKKNQISWQQPKEEHQIMVFEKDGWKGRYFDRGLGNIKWEGHDIESFKSKSQAIKWATEWMNYVDRKW
jgi:hypothetical protein